MANKEYEYKNFTRVEVTGTYDFEIVRADSFGVKVSSDEGFMKNVKVEQDGERLIVSHSRHISWMFRFIRPKATITMPVIKELKITGAVIGKVSEFKSKEDFNLDMTGASKVTLKINAGNTEIHVRGACTVEAKGGAESLIVDVNGASTLEMKDFTVNNAAVRLNGASSCSVKVNGRLDARLGGVSNLFLAGEPTIGDIRSTGMAKLTKIT
jgi:hypothetical protein